MGGQAEGHSTLGLSTLSPVWYFAEGDNAYFATYYALLNPGATDATVRLTYLHQNGQTYTQDVAVPAQRRATVLVSGVPAGGFGCQIAVLSGPPIAAERMLYGGPSWTISHAGVGADQTATTVRFTEGANGNLFETYLLLANPNPTTAAAVTLTFTRTDGTTILSSTTVPAAGRATVWTKGISGLESTSFRTLVSVTNGVGIVVERATYWPLNTGGQLEALLAPMLGSDEAVDPAAGREGPAVQTFDPYSPATAHGPAPRLYEHLIGYPGRTPGIDGSAPDTGPPVTGAGAQAGGLLPSTPLGTTSTTTLTWYGAHLTGGRRQ